MKAPNMPAIRVDANMCGCGRPLHYTSFEMERMMRAIVAREGVYVRIHALGFAWLLPRHFIALHGIAARDLPTTDCAVCLQALREDAAGPEGTGRPN